MTILLNKFYIIKIFIELFTMNRDFGVILSCQCNNDVFLYTVG